MRPRHYRAGCDPQFRPAPPARPPQGQCLEQTAAVRQRASKSLHASKGRAAKRARTADGRAEDTRTVQYKRRKALWSAVAAAIFTAQLACGFCGYVALLPDTRAWIAVQCEGPQLYAVCSPHLAQSTAAGMNSSGLRAWRVCPTCIDAAKRSSRAALAHCRQPLPLVTLLRSF